MKCLILVFAVITAPAQTGGSAEESFSADRPGFATSPVVLRRGITQIEGGIGLSIDGDRGGRTRALTVGSPLLRMGVGGRAELRVGGDGFRLLTDEAGRGEAGWSDLSFGAKVAVVPERGVIPAISLIPSVVIPAGQRAFTTGSYDPALGIAWAHSMPAGLSIGGTTTASRDTDDAAHYLLYSSALAVGIPAPRGWSTYGEVYVSGAAGSGGRPAWVGDAGLSRAVRENLSLDIEAGRRFSAGMPCWFLAGGFALRPFQVRR
jgi:hypothetical protein